jgi:cell division protein FtsB
MSALINQARSRVPRIAEAAVERARLTVVPRTVRSRAARVPFVVLVSLLLVAGVAGLLAFNTSMQQASFTATAMEQQAAALDARQQSLVMELDKLRDPQRVALRAKDMGMVAPSSPAFIRLSDGKVLGTPNPATYEDAIRVTPLPTRKPKSLRPTPVVIEVRPAKIAATSGGVDGAADPAEAVRAGTKKAQTSDGQQGGQR